MKGTILAGGSGTRESNGVVEFDAKGCAVSLEEKPAKAYDVAESPAQDAAPAGAPEILFFDHLGLIVPDLAGGRDFLASALGVVRWTPAVDDERLQVRVQFGSSAAGSMVYELIAPFGERSPIANALRSGKHILNHVAYRTADLEKAGQRLRSQGCYPAGDAQPAMAYGGKRVQFFVSPLRFVIELVEKPEHQHAFEEARKGAEPRR